MLTQSIDPILLQNFKGDFVKVFCVDDIMKPFLYSLQKAMTPDTNVVAADKIYFINRNGQIISIDKTLIPDNIKGLKTK